MLRGGGSSNVCPRCYRETEVRVFPALFRQAEPVAAPPIVQGESECYEHPGRRALSACSQCGRFVCALCEVELSGALWCPDCIHGGTRRQSISVLETRRTLYDSIALALAILPILTFYFALLAWPVPIYLSIRHWKSPGSILRRGKWRFAVALAVSAGEMALLVFLIISLVTFYGARRR